MSFPALSALTYLTVCEGGRCVQGGVDERARQVWDGVQGHMSMDVGVKMQSGVCGLLGAQELVAGRKGSSRHCRRRQSRRLLFTDVTFTSVWSLLCLKGRKKEVFSK